MYKGMCGNLSKGLKKFVNEKGWTKRTDMNQINHYTVVSIKES